MEICKKILNLKITRNIFYIVILATLTVLPTLTDGHKKSIRKRNVDVHDTSFDIALLRLEATRKLYKGVVVSPISVKIALAMILEGAEDETAAELRKALKLPDDEALRREETKKWVDIMTLDQRCDSKMNTTLKSANRIFIDQEYKIRGDYRHILQNFYNADAKVVNKYNPIQTANEINDWVKENTNGLIQEIINKDLINENFSLAVGNAVYFKGSWRYQFSKYSIIHKCFYKNGKYCRTTPMMSRFIHGLPYGFINKLKAHVVDLPYDDGRHSMVLLLPNQRDGIDDLVLDIENYTMDKITSRLILRNVYLEMPKFTLDYDNNLVSSLKSLEIYRVFKENAQLSRMIQNNNPSLRLYLSSVLHSSKIIVNEEGSEAAGATSVIIDVTLSAINYTVKQFIAEHPFLFFIRDTSTNAVLFAGKYTGS